MKMWKEKEQVAKQRQSLTVTVSQEPASQRDTMNQRRTSVPVPFVPRGPRVVAPRRPPPPATPTGQMLRPRAPFHHGQVSSLSVGASQLGTSIRPMRGGRGNLQTRGGGRGKGLGAINQRLPMIRARAGPGPRGPACRAPNPMTPNQAEQPRPTLPGQAGRGRGTFTPAVRVPFRPPARYLPPPRQFINTTILSTPTPTVTYSAPLLPSFPPESAVIDAMFTGEQDLPFSVQTPLSGAQFDTDLNGTDAFSLLETQNEPTNDEPLCQSTPLLDFLEAQREKKGLRKQRKYRQDAEALVLTDENIFDDSYQISAPESSASAQQQEMAEYYNAEQRKARAALEQYNRSTRRANFLTDNFRQLEQEGNLDRANLPALAPFPVAGDVNNPYKVSEQHVLIQSARQQERQKVEDSIQAVLFSALLPNLPSSGDGTQHPLEPVDEQLEGE